MKVEQVKQTMKNEIENTEYRIGIFTACLPYQGGIFQYTLTILETFNDWLKDGKISKIVLFCFDKEWVEIAKNYSVECIVIKNRVRKYPTWTIFKRFSSKHNAIYHLFQKLNNKCYEVGRIIEKQKLDLCFYTTWEKESIMFSTITLVASHDLMHRYEPNFPEAQEDFKISEWIMRGLVNYAKAIIADSKLGKKQIEELYANGQVLDKIYSLPYIPPNYIYAEDIVLTDKELDILKKLPNKFLFYPAQFWKHKNHINIVKAMQQLKEQGKETAIVFCGGPQNGYNAIIDYIEIHRMKENIIFLGYASNQIIKELYRRAVALIMPTYFGPTNIPPLEAFYLGCPVATSNIYGIPEQLGDAALLFNPSNVDEIAECIEKLWENDLYRKQLIQKGYLHAKQWGKEQFSNTLFEIVEDVIIGIRSNGNI